MGVIGKTMTPDGELLHRYATTGGDDAFAEIVRRQVGLVYSVALRMTNGNAALAEDVTQIVFTDLARKARPLAHHPALAGWLHTSTRFAAMKAVRSEQRRQVHEKEAFTMQTLTTSPEIDWEQLRPVLDEAVGHLREKDRAVVVLRFFQGLSHREVGEALGLNENTARMRLDHALEKLRTHFAKAGITVSSALLASTLSAHSIQFAPPGLAEKITKPCLIGAVGGVSGGILALALFRIFLMSTKTKITLLAITAIVAVIAIVATKQGSPENPKTIATAPTPAATTVKAPAIANAVAAPVIPPSAPISTVPATTTAVITAPVDPRTSVDTAIAEAIRALENTDMVAFFKEVAPPDQLARLSPGQLETIAEANMQNPGAKRGMAAALAALKSVQGQQPILSDNGDTATFETTIPSSDGSMYQVVLKRQSGLWYLARIPH